MCAVRLLVECTYLCSNTIMIGMFRVGIGFRLHQVTDDLLRRRVSVRPGGRILLHLHPHFRQQADNQRIIADIIQAIFVAFIGQRMKRTVGQTDVFVKFSVKLLHRA
ncbi:hypothetical protein SGGMMB4_03939 [Sodalis glossinidius str. 'morsitans']|uniref:Uncharacterized protein n=2 Tax=Sodalis glossinidius TaxID=63612 RepID=A0A193QLP7_SODGM|nr:hypothetical protein SGGMMB4_03939 [Sodalis glossinidius str. 'morsitans']